MAKEHSQLLWKSQIGLSYLLRGSILIAGIGAGISKNWTLLFISLLILFTTFLPSLIQRKYDVLLPVEFELVFVIFTYFSLFLGELYNFYEKFWWWDVILHGSAGIVIGLIAFIFITLIYINSNIDSSAILFAIFTFSFAVCVGALWEIFEFSMDQLFNWDMQVSGVDTMYDLILDSFGGLIAAISGYIFIKFNKSKVVRHILIDLITMNPGFFNGNNKKE